MATTNGNGGIVLVGANAIAEIIDFSFDEAVSPPDDTVLGDTSATHKNGGIKSWSGSISCYWDTTDTNGQVALAIDSAVSLTMLPEGNTSGDTNYVGTATIVGIGRANANDTIVTQSFTFTGNGTLVIGTVT